MVLKNDLFRVLEWTFHSALSLFSELSGVLNCKSKNCMLKCINMFIIPEGRCIVEWMFHICMLKQIYHSFLLSGSYISYVWLSMQIYHREIFLVCDEWIIQLKVGNLCLHGVCPTMIRDWFNWIANCIMETCMSRIWWRLTLILWALQKKLCRNKSSALTLEGKFFAYRYTCLSYYFEILTLNFPILTYVQLSLKNRMKKKDTGKLLDGIHILGDVGGITAER